MTTPTAWPDQQFVITYVPLPRMWCTLCEKSKPLDSLDQATLLAVQAAHRCGPRAAAQRPEVR